jgi:hypothetical protein
MKGANKSLAPTKVCVHVTFSLQALLLWLANLSAIMIYSFPMQLCWCSQHKLSAPVGHPLLVKELKGHTDRVTAVAFR